MNSLNLLFTIMAIITLGVILYGNLNFRKVKAETRDYLNKMRKDRDLRK